MKEIHINCPSCTSSYTLKFNPAAAPKKNVSFTCTSCNNKLLLQVAKHQPTV